MSEAATADVMINIKAGNAALDIKSVIVSIPNGTSVKLISFSGPYNCASISDEHCRY